MSGVNEKEKKTASARDNAVFRSSVNKDEQDLLVRKKSNASEGFNFVVKRENVVGKVVAG